MARKLGVLILLVIAFGAGIGLTYWVLQGGGGLAVTRNLGPNTPVPIKLDTTAIASPGAIAEAARRVEPSVVTIDTEYRPQTTYGFSDFFGFGAQQQVIPRGTGSGVIISPDGIIVTNNHVVRNATKISVTLQNGQEMTGTVLGADAQSDLAVVKVAANNLPAVTLADSDKVEVGEWVIAVGDPLGVGITVTHGIVSAVRKGSSTAAEPALASSIQTDAPINPGNSGGALADLEGRLIGINTAIASNNGGSIGIGFAIPANTVRTVAQELITQGRVIHPWLGIAFGPMSDRARAALNIPPDVNGIIISQVLQGSPADQAGVQPGDVIRRANGQDLRTPADLAAMIQGMKVGETLRLDVWRAGAERSLTATLQARPATPVNS